MAFEKVDPKADFPALEREILEFWRETGAFEKLREINKGKPKWSFLDGPITANNPMGVHHAWGRTYKDLYQRYQASIGRELRYQNGFDCQGLWVEVEVEREHGFEDKKQIESFGIGKFVEECKARAAKYADIQTEQSKRLGYWMDWDNSYYTMSDENNYGIWAFLKKCYEKGLVYKGMDVMPWCPRCGTGISQMEMNEGYRDVPHTSVFITLPLRDYPGENLLVWTTTPWTLSSNVAAAVHPKMTYVKVKQGDQFYYLGKGNLENARAHPIEGAAKSKLPGLMSIRAMFNNKGDFEVVEELQGSSLVDRTYDGPFDALDGAAEAIPVHRVIAWNEISESEGSGIVHIAPGCGSEDYRLGKELGLPQIAPLFENGTFRPEFGFLAGRRFDQVTEDIVADLKTRGRLFAKEQYHHRYPHCWRCKEELVYRLVDEWLINMNWRDRIMEATKGARWIPEWGLERELDWLRNMGDWMISKKRYWGLALPIWECHECGHFEVIGDRDELKARAVSGWDQFEGHSPHRPWIDAVKIRCAQCGSETVSRVKDVGTPWLDASIVSFSTMGYFSDREYWEQWFPADFVVESLPGQFRNWFYALLAISTMMVDRPPFKVLKGHGLVMDDQGKPMHKSAGNAIEFNKAADEIGVDVMRWLYAATSPERNVLFGPQHCDETRRDVILPWWNVYSFFCNLAQVDDFDPKKHVADAADRTPLDRWILSDLNELIKTAHTAYSGFDVATFCKKAREFIVALSTWYLRRSRRRFYGDEWTGDKRAAYGTLHEVLVTLNRLMAPVVPFLSERIYQNLAVRQDPSAPSSVHHTPFPTADEALIDSELSSQIYAVRSIVSLGRAARKKASLKIRQPLKLGVVFSTSDVVKKAVAEFSLEIEDELNIKGIRHGVPEDELYEDVLSPKKKSIFENYASKGKGIIEAISKTPQAELLTWFKTQKPRLLKVANEEIEFDPFVCLLPSTTYAEGWEGARDGFSHFVLRTVLTPELKQEGIARDIVRNVQNLRKDAGLDIADRIKLALVADSPEIQAAVDQFDQYLRSETLAVDVQSTPIGRDPTSVESVEGEPARASVKIDGQPVTIELVKRR